MFWVLLHMERSHRPSRLVQSCLNIKEFPLQLLVLIVMIFISVHYCIHRSACHIIISVCMMLARMCGLVSLSE